MGWHRWAGIGGRPAGYGVGHVARGGALGADKAFQSAHLGQMRPVAVAHQQVGGPSAYGGPLFDPATMLVNLHRLGLFQFPIPDGGYVLQQGRLVALYGKEVIPP